MINGGGRNSKTFIEDIIEKIVSNDLTEKRLRSDKNLRYVTDKSRDFV